MNDKRFTPIALLVGMGTLGYLNRSSHKPIIAPAIPNMCPEHILQVLDVQTMLIAHGL
jgi:hypothetical protein